MLAPQRPNTTADLFFITDNYAQGWSQSGIARLMHDMGMPVRVHVIRVGPERPQNAWIAEAEFNQTEQPLRRAIRVRIGAVGDQAQVARQRRDTALGIADGQTATTPDTILNLVNYVRDELLLQYAGNEEVLEQYGFDIAIGTAKSPTRSQKTVAATT